MAARNLERVLRKIVNEVASSAKHYVKMNKMNVITEQQMQIEIRRICLNVINNYVQRIS